MSLDSQQTGDAEMRECPHHEGIENTLHDIRTEIRAIRSTQDAMMLHLIPQATRTNGNGTHVSVQATGQQAVPMQQSARDDVPWAKVASLLLVIAGALVVIVEHAIR
jgi:hypothetical protein